MDLFRFSNIGALRYYESSLPPERLRLLLDSAFADKGYTQKAIAYLAAQDTPTGGFLGSLLGHLLMRTPRKGYYSVLQRAAETLSDPSYAPLFADPTYRGGPRENASIDSSIARSDARDGFRSSIGRGAARLFSLQGFLLPEDDRALARVPIVILGAGAAGTMMARALLNAGFRSLTVLDQTGRYGGIWNQRNVREGSKNNPFSFAFEGLYVDQAPGPGESITSFLASVVNSSHFALPLPAVKKAKVLRVEPGDLASCVTYSDEAGQHTLETPILINALGVGKPLAPSRPGVMTTDVEMHEAGIRWQQILDERQARALGGKMLVFIGLGNSTAEMMLQIQRYNRRLGLHIRYKVLTHYPQASLARPGSFVTENGKAFRLYRDTQFPQLTSLAGDLEEIEYAFEQARDSCNPGLEEIISDVIHWTITRSNDIKTMCITLADGSTRAWDFDQLYTLIGYGHRKEELEDLGLLVTDPYLGSIAYDYDGEIQRAIGALGRDRVWPGYFGLGSLLKSPANPNAQVIPGILFRAPDVLASLIFRSAEYVLREQRRTKSRS